MSDKKKREDTASTDQVIPRATAMKDPERTAQPTGGAHVVMGRDPCASKPERIWKSGSSQVEDK